MIDQMPGSRDLHGSSISEQNHSSCLCYLNDEQSSDNKYCEDPVTYVKDLFGRQLKLDMKMNELLFDAKPQIAIEKEHLQCENPCWRTVQLLASLDHQCLPKYKQFT